MTSRDAAGRNRVTRMTSAGTLKNVWAETPRAEGGDLALAERDDQFHPVTGDDLTQLFHGSRAPAFQLHLNGIEPAAGLSDDGMLGDDVDEAVFLTPDYDEALTYGDTVVRVDARGLDLVVVDGPDGYHYAATETINPLRLSEATQTVGFEDVLDPTMRADCVAFDRRHVPGPRHPARYTADWERAHTKPTYELEKGDRVHAGVVTGVHEIDGDHVLVHVDGEADPSLKLDFDAAVTVHNDPVDLSDPDWFETETQRVTKQRIAAARGAGLTVNRKQAHDVETEVRAALTRAHQPGRATTLTDEHPDACHGRAKVGQQVSFEQPAGSGAGNRTYVVTGKRATSTLVHDGTRSFPVEDGGVEYVLTDLRTGNQTLTDMRQVGWRHEGR